MDINTNQFASLSAESPESHLAQIACEEVYGAIVPMSAVEDYLELMLPQ